MCEVWAVPTDMTFRCLIFALVLSFPLQVFAPAPSSLILSTREYKNTSCSSTYSEHSYEFKLLDTDFICSTLQVYNLNVSESYKILTPVGFCHQLSAYDWLCSRLQASRDATKARASS